LSIGNVDGLIQDWRRDKKRRSRRGTFATNPKGYRQFVATVASQYLPQIRSFITTDYQHRKVVLKAWKQLISDLGEDMRMLDAFDPTGNTHFFAAIVIAQGTLRDKEVQKAFEQSKKEPSDNFGNPEFISCLAASLDTILDQTYHAMRGMIGKDLRLSLVRKASQKLHNALEQGLVEDLNDLNSLLLPSLAIVEMELEKFHIEKLRAS
jgi:hypothetical protein